MELYYRTGNIIQRSAWLPLRIYFSSLGRFEVQGAEHIKSLQTNVIFASNHSSEYDPLLMAAAMPFFSRHLPLVFVANSSTHYKNFGWRGKFYGGSLFKLMAALEVYKGLYDYEDALKHHVHALRSGKNVCIFPMGKMHRLDDTSNARGGATFLAEATNVPIIPTYIGDTKTPHSSSSNQRQLRVMFGEPITFSKLQERSDHSHPNKYEAAAIALMQIVATLDAGQLSVPSAIEPRQSIYKQ